MLTIPDVLHAVNIPVAPTPGWESRGRGDRPIVPAGIVVHDDVMPDSVSLDRRLRMLREGRPDLPGPLCHVSLTKDGTWHLIAAGRANHAGRGYWEGIDDGNGRMLGIECAWAPGEDYPPAQIDSLVRGVAALCRYWGLATQMVAHHWEYARPSGRKVDMQWRGPLRESVALHVLNQAGVQPGQLDGFPPDYVEDDMPRPTDITAELRTPSGDGAWLLQYDGGVITEGDAPYLGSYPGLPEDQRRGERGFYVLEPFDGGYLLRGTDRSVYRFPAPLRAAA